MLQGAICVVRHSKSERFSELLSLIETGIVRTGDLARRIGLGWKQTSRLLDSMVEEGLLQKPVRGVYYSFQTQVVSLEDFASNHVSKNVVDEMSKTYKQNNTYTPKGILVAWRPSEPEIKDKSVLPPDLPRTLDSPEAVVRRILEVCRIEQYTLEDERYCVHVLGDVWSEFTVENVEPIAAQAMMRFATEERVPSRNSLAYLCGIARRIVLASRERVMRNYRQFLRDYPMLAAVGMEEVAAGSEVTPAYVEEVAASRESSVETHDTVDREDIKEEFAPEWVTVADKLLEMATTASAFTVKEPTIHRVVIGLRERDAKAAAVLDALEYMDHNNPKGKVYFINHLNNAYKVDEAIRRNYMWFLNYGLDGPEPKEMAQASNHRDERYAAFYKLFPDA